MDDVPEQQHEPRERARLYAQGHRIDNGSSCVLLVIHADDAWSIHGLDPDAGVRVSNDVMVTPATSIVQRDAEQSTCDRRPAPVELPHRFAPDGRPVPTSTLSGSCHSDRFVRSPALRFHERPTMAEGAPESQPARGNRKAIPVSCALHQGPRCFANLMVERKRDGDIVLDPHVTGACVIILDPAAATTLFDLLGTWLG